LAGGGGGGLAGSGIHLKSRRKPGIIKTKEHGSGEIEWGEEHNLRREILGKEGQRVSETLTRREMVAGFAF